MAAAVRPYEDETAVLATMHGKEQVIAPLLARALGLRVRVSEGIDTDQFGTFSRDFERTGSQLDAARAKIAAAFAAVPDATVALASEGSFGPHPYIPFVPMAREILVLADRARGLELIGHHADLATDFSHAVVPDAAGAFAFAERIWISRPRRNRHRLPGSATGARHRACQGCPKPGGAFRGGRAGDRPVRQRLHRGPICARTAIRPACSRSKGRHWTWFAATAAHVRGARHQDSRSRSGSLASLFVVRVPDTRDPGRRDVVRRL